jgi:hypothetical protein
MSLSDFQARALTHALARVCSLWPCASLCVCSYARSHVRMRICMYLCVCVHPSGLSGRSLAAALLLAGHLRPSGPAPV